MTQRPSAFLASIAVVMLAAGLLLFHFTGGLRGKSENTSGDKPAAPSIIDAITSRNLAALKAAVSAGADVNTPVALGPNAGMTPLHLAAAASASTPEIIKTLLAAGSNIDARMPDGRTPLMLAADTGRTEVLGTLANSAAALDARDQLGRTALMHAARAGRADSIRLLLAAGASVNPADDSGATALAHASGSTDPAGIAVLLEAKADPDAADSAGVTPLMRAAEFSGAQPDRILTLLNAGANPRAKATDGRTALDRARSRTDPNGRRCADILEQAGL